MSEYTSISRVTHIPFVESGIATVHSTLSSTPLLRTPYAISLSVSNRLAPLFYSVCAHYPLAPLIHVGDKAANRTLDIAQGKWPYPFQTNPEQIWKDVQSAAKNVDQKFAPIVDTFSTMVTKISGNNVEAGKTNDNTYQFQRAYTLLQAIKDDLIRSTDEQATIIKSIHAVLTRATEQSGTIIEAILSRSEDAASKTQVLGRSVLAELERLPPLLTALSSNASTTLRDTINSLRTTLYTDEPWTQKLPKVKNTLQDGIKDVIEDVFAKIHEVIDDIRTPSSTTSPTGTVPLPVEPEKPAEETGSQSEKKRRDKNTRIVTNIKTGGTVLSMSEDTIPNKSPKTPVRDNSVLNFKNTSTKKKESRGRKKLKPFENDNIATAGSHLTQNC